MKRKKGFTLIELIAVLVIMAILALIVTPLVMTIIRKARISADKRSIDAYGRSIELAITGYLMDNGAFPTSIEDLTIEYSGPEVVCSTARLNPDNSVYLTGCTVSGRTVNYEYGTDKIPTYKAYSVGDEVTYNNVDYRVIKDSPASESTVTLLKSEPLTVAEVNLYGGVGTANNHVNMNETDDTTASYYQQAYNNNGYGGLQYYSSPTCHAYGDISGCKSDYASSEVKYVVDAWKVAQAPLASEARILVLDDFEELGYVEGQLTPSDIGWIKTNETPSWLYSCGYYQWIGSPYNDSTSDAWCINSSGSLEHASVRYGGGNLVRPVITLSKTNISS